MRQGASAFQAMIGWVNQNRPTKCVGRYSAQKHGDIQEGSFSLPPTYSFRDVDAQVFCFRAPPKPLARHAKTLNRKTWPAERR